MAVGEPLVSVIVPTYNREGFLREAVASVFAQTFRDWELIVVDDGSTDGTREYLATLDDSRVNVLLSERCGSPGRMRNLGLKEARGFYVAFLDDDDLWMPQKLERQIAALAADTRCRWNYTYFTQVNDVGQVVPLPPGVEQQPCDGWVLEPLLRGTAWLLPSALVIEHALISSIGGFDETMGTSEDYDAFLKIARLAEISVLTLPLAAHRVHRGNTWKGMERSEVARRQVRLYSRVLAAPLRSTERQACQQQLLAARTRLADSYRAERRYGKALGALARSAPRGLAARAWWVALLKTLVRPLMPEQAMRLYRAVRDR